MRRDVVSRVQFTLIASDKLRRAGAERRIPFDDHPIVIDLLDNRDHRADAGAVTP